VATQTSRAEDPLDAPDVRDDLGLFALRLARSKRGDGEDGSEASDASKHWRETCNRQPSQPS
jgi:hypothetical protein